MIQRFQTILLVLAAAANISGLFAPFWYFANNNMHNPQERTATLFGKEVKMQVMDMAAGDWTTSVVPMGDTPLVMVYMGLAGLTSLLMLIIIFLFKKRPLQIKLTYATMVLVLIQFIVIVLQSQKLGALTGEVEKSSFDEGPSWGYAIPVLTLLLTWWAARRINKDEKLVKSMDRLR